MYQKLQQHIAAQAGLLIDSSNVQVVVTVIHSSADSLERSQ
jgi:hypothetical protein